MTTSCGRRRVATTRPRPAPRWQAVLYSADLAPISCCEEWYEACRAVDEKQGALKHKKERDAAKRAYLSASEAFCSQKPATTLGLFLQLLMSDEGDDFADEHLEDVETIIQQLQSPIVRIRGATALR